jgi:hypothetical protein
LIREYYHENFSSGTIDNAPLIGGIFVIAFERFRF